MARYDEDLHENIFFQTLVGKHGGLFNEAAENRWMICVPRFDTVSRLKLSRTDFENHLLRPVNEEARRDFISANKKHVVIEGEIVTVGQGYKEARSVKILFEECFFNSKEESYQVFCLDQPLEGALGDEVLISLESLEDCGKFLWAEPGSEKVKRSVDHLLDIFQIERGTLRPIMDAASAIYTRAVQEVFKLRKFQIASQKNFCKLAVETYIMDGLFRRVFKEVCFLSATKDAELNKITRNLSDTHPHYLGIKAQFRLSVPKAKHILSRLNQFTTPLEKLYCFKKCISTLTEMPLEGAYEVVSADELLPILVYLVIVCDIPNWNGNLTYIAKFHFSNVGMEEFAYYLTSFEAAVEYVRSEAKQLASMTTGIAKATVWRLRSNSRGPDDEASPVNQYFKSVCEGSVSAVDSLLEQAQRDSEEAKAMFCHPLCACKKCSALEERQLDDSHRVTVYCRDGDGRTGLHHAARMGHSNVVQLLLEHGAIVGATDHHSSTALHLACQKGHQKCALMLLGEGGSVNITDNHGNTPLHLACSNGHEECVKALLFHKDHCNINAANDQGDTPLHNAARWGYASIVRILLEHKASVTVHNRNRELPIQCAQSRKVLELLFAARKKPVSIAVKEGANEVKAIPSRKSESTKNRRMSQKSSNSVNEPDRQLKKLFGAIRDNDINYVRYLFGWEEAETPEDKAGGTGGKHLCHPLCQCEKCSRLRRLSSSGALLVNSSGPQGLTPLHVAALQGHRKMVELLLRHGAAIDTSASDKSLTPLHLACQYNHKDVVLILLDHEAQINPYDKQGNTPLHFACNNGHIESATLLLFHGADVAVSNSRGDTPLHNAARWNHPTLVNELMLYGAQYSVTNNNNKTPMDLTTIMVLISVSLIPNLWGLGTRLLHIPLAWVHILFSRKHDDEVKLTIEKAMRGEIEVGSYKLPLRSNELPEEGVTQNIEPLKGVPPDDTGEHVESSPITIQRKPKADSGADLLAKSSESPRVSKRDEKLDKLLRAIESYDRTTSLRQTETDDRSAPVLQPPPETPQSAPATETHLDLSLSISSFGAL